MRIFNFSFSRLLENDRFVKLISVVVAIIAWIIVAITIDTDLTINIRNVPISLSTTGTQAEVYGLSVVDISQQSVDIKVEGKRYKVGNLSIYDFVAVPNFNPVTKAGKYKLNIDIKKVNSNDDDYTILPINVNATVTLDYLIENEFQVNTVAENIVAVEGYIKEQPVSNVKSIKLKGPKIELEQIQKVVISTDLNKKSDETITTPGKLIFYNIHGKPIELKNVHYIEDTFDITVPIYKIKTLPVNLKFVNVPLGIDVNKLPYVLSHNTIEVAGPKEIIDNMESVPLSDIYFNKLDVNTSLKLNVELETSLINVNNIDKIDFSLNSNKLSKRQLNVDKIIIKNKPDEYDIKIKTKIINDVWIVGLLSDIDVLKATDLVAEIDLTGATLTNGTSVLPVKIFANDKYIWAYGEYTIVVQTSRV